MPFALALNLRKPRSSRMGARAFVYVQMNTVYVQVNTVLESTSSTLMQDTSLAFHPRIA